MKVGARQMGQEEEIHETRGRGGKENTQTGIMAQLIAATAPVDSPGCYYVCVCVCVCVCVLALWLTNRQCNHPEPQNPMWGSSSTEQQQQTGRPLHSCSVSGQ